MAFAPPPISEIYNLTKLALKFGAKNESSIRKHDLVNFSANNVVVRAFLECWCGHSSQVFLGYNQKWQDRSFNAYYTSAIATSSEWVALGLPPESFIKWKRRDRISAGCRSLFGHGERVVKMSEKLYLEGLGALAEGTLMQGLLADRWVLNAGA